MGLLILLCCVGDWGLGTGDWGLGIGDWGLGTGDKGIRGQGEITNTYYLLPITHYPSWRIQRIDDKIGGQLACRKRAVVLILFGVGNWFKMLYLC